MVAEAVGALVLSFGWAAAVFNRYTVGLKSASVGLGYALGMVVASSASIGLINPGVALADRAWTIWGSAGWGTYVLGPVLGALVGVNLYAWLFADGVRLLPARAARTTTASTASKTTVKKSSAKRKTTKRK
jgi:glycerol uptake facilitator-like aquaporin